MNVTKVLILLALVCFLLATFGVSFPHVVLLPLGLVFFMASKLL